LNTSIENRILNLLKTFRWGLTSKEIAEKIGVSRITVAKYLEKLKAEGVLAHRKVGAYRVWFIKSIAEEAKKVLPKRIICSLGKAFLIMFGEEAFKIAFQVGSILIDEMYDILPIEETKREDIFSYVAEIISLISEGVRAEGIKLRNQRGILRVFVEDSLLDPEIVRLISYLLSGAINGVCAKILEKKIKVLEPIIREKDNGFEIVVEVEL